MRRLWAYRPEAGARGQNQSGWTYRAGITAGCEDCGRQRLAFAGKRRTRVEAMTMGSPHFSFGRLLATSGIRVRWIHLVSCIPLGDSRLPLHLRLANSGEEQNIQIANHRQDKRVMNAHAISDKSLRQRNDRAAYDGGVQHA